MTSKWNKKYWLVFLSLILLGQSCSISLGSNAVADGGVFRSDDGGQTWQQKTFVRQDKKQIQSISNVNGEVVAFDPQNKDTLYLGTRENGVWRTTNGGDSWTPTSLKSGDYPCLQFDPSNASILYTVSGPLVLKSLDAGQSWQTLYTESQPEQTVTCVAVDPLHGNTVWVVTSGGKILLSDDYGHNWTLVHTIPSGVVRAMEVLKNGSGTLAIFTKTNGIFLGTGRGSAWEDLSVNLQAFPGATDIRSVDLVEMAAERWFLGTANGLLSSSDQGKNWTSIPTLLTPQSIPVNAVAVNPENGNEIFLTVNQKLHHTRDGGATWSVTTLPTSRLPVILAFDPHQTDRLFFSTLKIKKK